MATHRDYVDVGGVVQHRPIDYEKIARFEEYDYFPMRFVDFYNQITSIGADFADSFLRMNDAQNFIETLNLRGTQTTILKESVDTANRMKDYLELKLLLSSPDKEAMIYINALHFQYINGFRIYFKSESYYPFIRAYFAILTKLIRREERRRDALLTELEILQVNVEETNSKITQDLREMKLHVREINEDSLIPDPNEFRKRFDRVRRDIESLKMTLAFAFERQRIRMASTPTRRLKRARACPAVSPINPRAIPLDRGINQTFMAPGLPHPGVRTRRSAPVVRITKPVVKSTKTVARITKPVVSYPVRYTTPPRDDSRHVRVPSQLRVRIPSQRQDNPQDYAIINDHIHGLDESFRGNLNVTLGHKDEDLDWSLDPYVYIEIPELGRKFRVEEMWGDELNRDREYMKSLNRHGESDRREPVPLPPVQFDVIFRQIN